MDFGPPENITSEQEILNALFQDPRRQWDCFAQAYAGSIEKWVRFFRIPGLEFEDLLQDVYYELMRNNLARLRQWDSQRGGFRAFLRVVVSRILVDLYRAHTRTSLPVINPALPDHEEFDPWQWIEAESLNPRDMAIESEEVNLIWRLVDRLVKHKNIQPEDAIILRCKALGIDTKQIARLLGMTINLVDVRFHRLKQILHESAIGNWQRDVTS